MIINKKSILITTILATLAIGCGDGDKKDKVKGEKGKATPSKPVKTKTEPSNKNTEPTTTKPSAKPSKTAEPSNKKQPSTSNKVNNPNKPLELKTVLTKNSEWEVIKDSVLYKHIKKYIESFNFNDVAKKQAYNLDKQITAKQVLAEKSLKKDFEKYKKANPSEGKWNNIKSWKNWFSQQGTKIPFYKNEYASDTTNTLRQKITNLKAEKKKYDNLQNTTTSVKTVRLTVEDDNGLVATWIKNESKENIILKLILDKTEKAKFVVADNGAMSVTFSDYNEVIKLADSNTINDENDDLLLTKIK